MLLGSSAGIALAAKAVRPETLIVGAEPVGNNESADVAQSLIEGRCISDLPAPDTIADGLRGKMGDLTWPIIRDHVDGVVTVTEREIVDAMTLIFERMKARGRKGKGFVLSEAVGAFLCS